jgi:hypothetical protein
MSRTIHFANIDFEHELDGKLTLSISKNWGGNPLALQLQFLPLFYAESDDFIAVTHLPDQAFLDVLTKNQWIHHPPPQFYLIDSSVPSTVERCASWGPSKIIQQWADAHHLVYEIPPDFEMIRLINSKAFSSHFSSLEGAELLLNEEQLIQWAKKLSGPKVVKSCFGLSGQGNRKFDSFSIPSPVLSFCKKEWIKGNPVIGEPWVDRCLDFSTQWLIHEGGSIEFIGATRFKTGANGVYEGTVAGPENVLFADFISHLEEQKQRGEEVLREIQQLGFFGSIGIDAFLYRKEGEKEVYLNPVLEINARKTMSWVALYLQKKIAPDQLLDFQFNRNHSGDEFFLPKSIVDDTGKMISFRRHLKISLFN